MYDKLKGVIGGKLTKMKNLHIIKKTLSFITCAAVSLGFVTAYSVKSREEQPLSAKTISQIQEQRKENDEQIKELESQITSLEGDKENEKAYQATLIEQISLIQENIQLLNTELDQIGEDITTAENNIRQLDQDIVDQQAAIDENVELFKQRLCAMYVTGNDNLASVLLGSASFYDMMSRVQMVNRIAEYDDELINNILDEIDSLEKSKKDIETERLNLQLKLEEQEKRKAEKEADIASLNEKMQNTQDIIDKLAMDQEALSRSKEQIEQEQAALDAEEAEIQRRIAEAQARYEREQEYAREVAKKAAEEAAAKKAEEAARKAAEEAAAKKAAAEAERKAAEEAARKAAEEAARIAAQKAAEEEAQKALEEARKKAEEEEAAKQAAAAAAKKAAEEEAMRVAQQEAEKAAAASLNNQTVTPSVPAATTTPTVSSSGFAWPAPGFSYISSYFGARWGTTHKGIDIGDAGISGGSAVASRSGSVVYVNNSCTHDYAKSYSCGCGGGYGNYVVIAHDGTYSTLYGHLKYATVSVGDYVSQGDVIGVIGSTGYSTGAHLHFEVRVNGSQVDPTSYVNP